MAKQYKSNLYFSNLKFTLTDFLRENKGKCIILIFCIALALLTGIFTAIKIIDKDNLSLYEEFNICKNLSDSYNFSSFFSRFLSTELNITIVLLFAQIPFLNIFGVCLISYRTFLISLNCAMITISYGFGGILKSLIIIFPCQILTIVILSIYFCISTSQAKERKNYCKGWQNTMLITFAICSLSILIINFVETILLYLFRSSVILVI